MTDSVCHWLVAVHIKLNIRHHLSLIQQYAWNFSRDLLSLSYLSRPLLSEYVYPLFWRCWIFSRFIMIQINTFFFVQWQGFLLLILKYFQLLHRSLTGLEWSKPRTVPYMLLHNSSTTTNIFQTPLTASAKKEGKCLSFKIARLCWISNRHHKFL